LNKKAEIAIDQIFTISKNRLNNKTDKLSDIEAAQLQKIIIRMAKKFSVNNYSLQYRFRRVKK
jgi:hypothetical protein